MEGCYGHTNNEPYDYDGLEVRSDNTISTNFTELDRKAKIAEAALARIINHIGSARECKIIAKTALDEIRKERVT